LKILRDKDKIVSFTKLMMASVITGIVGGIVGAVFHKSVELVTELRGENPWLLYFLPVAGVVIVLLYRLFRLVEQIGTNDILTAVSEKGKTVPILLAPAIFLSTVITHMFGGSAGREGAALQLGGSIAAFFGRIFRIGEKETPIVIMCGMAAVISALFQTPLTATFFAMEVVSVGVIYFSALVPSLCSALIAYKVALLFGAHPEFYDVVMPNISLEMCIKVTLLAIFCGLLSIVFCVTMHKTGGLLKKYIPNSYIRIIAGGAVIVLLTLVLKTYDYNGAGTGIIANAMQGIAKPEAFVLKIIFTAITIGAGFRGGEIVPTFFIGSTFGCVAAGLVGMEPSMGAAIGLVALFCGVVNCPIASIFLSIELFGAEGILFFAIACGVSYLVSGYYGLYSKQKIMYSKLRVEYIDQYTK